jgi:hypothetical protein
MKLKSDGRHVKIVQHDRKKMPVDFITGATLTDQYVYALVPYNKTEMKFRKDKRTHHLQLIKKENLAETR